MSDTPFFNTLDNLLEDRKKNLPEDAYTTSLYTAGIDRILRKVGEETGEVIIAAKNQDKKELLNEASDLVFHLAVLLHHQGLSLQDIQSCLQKRHNAPRR